MARRVKISLLCAANLQRDYNLGSIRLAEDYCTWWDRQIDQVLPSRPDLIILPEGCDTYYNFNPEQQIAYLAASDGIVRDHLCATAKQNNCCIAYSALRYCPEDKQFPIRNSTQMIARDGSITGIYDKNHVTIDECEINRCGYGRTAELIETDFGKAACAICFDLNFDDLLLRYASLKPDLVIFSSQYHGGLRQEQWAYTCRCHFAGAVAGDQGRIINPLGETLAFTTNYYNHVTYTVNLDCAVAHIDYNNRRFTEAKKKYSEAFTIHDPGHVGSVLLTCEADDITIDDIMREFEIEPLDDYFARACAHRNKYIKRK